jgi:hypothetical protein
MTMRTVIIIIYAIATVCGTAAVVAQPTYCSTFAGVRTCSSPGGYVSHESTWNGITTGDDNAGDRWSSWRWRDTDITTVEPRH